VTREELPSQAQLDACGWGYDGEADYGYGYGSGEMWPFVAHVSAHDHCFHGHDQPGVGGERF